MNSNSVSISLAWKNINSGEWWSLISRACCNRNIHKWTFLWRTFAIIFSRAEMEPFENVWEGGKVCGKESRLQNFAMDKGSATRPQWALKTEPSLGFSGVWRQPSGGVCWSKCWRGKLLLAVEFGIAGNGTRKSRHRQRDSMLRKMCCFGNFAFVDR